MFRKSILFLSLFFLLVFTNAQPFAADIAAFKKQDAISFPPKNAILFVGSSSFTNWKDVQDYFPTHTIINRGFGGSSLPDLIRFEQEVIFTYQPGQVVIYCGENDLAASDTVSARTVFERFKQLFGDIRRVFSGIHVVYISMKPSPSRWYMKERAVESNKLIAHFLSKEKNAKFISVWERMLGPDGNPRVDIFVEDKLHMNARGYAIWKELIEPYLMK